MDLTHKIVRRLLRDDDVNFSRNKNFEAYEDARVKRALRIFRHLRSLERDLLALDDGGAVQLTAVERDDDQVTVRLSFADQQGHRVSYLSAREWMLLLESERVAQILGDLIDAAAADTQRVLGQCLALDSDLTRKNDE